MVGVFCLGVLGLTLQVNDGDNLIQPIDARNVAQVLMAIVDDPVSEVKTGVQESTPFAPLAILAFAPTATAAPLLLRLFRGSETATHSPEPTAVSRLLVIINVNAFSLCRSCAAEALPTSR